MNGVVVADVGGRIVSWDAGAEALFGHAAADAIGRTLDLIVPEDLREQHWTGFHRAMASGVCKLDRAAANLPVLHADGEVRLVPGRFIFLTDGRGAPAGAAAVYTEPVGGEEPWGPVLPLPDDRDAA